MAVRSGFHHVAVNVRDLKEAISFYEALGAKFLRAWPPEAPTAAMIDVGGSRIEFFAKGDGDPEADAMIPHFALNSDDVDGDFAIALAHGAKPQTEPKDVMLPSEPPLPVRLAFFVGLSGEVVELFQEKE
ncbi:MAG: VOC family protein [Clostridiales bacterium]|nr:VOC family protein [Clostridiales bacterium]